MPGARPVSRLVLASASPRRRDLIGLLGLPVITDAAGVDETIPPGADPPRVACELAVAKARAVAPRHPGATVVGADTIVVLDRTILGKPVDAADALVMLRQLRGRPHQVITALAVLHPGGVEQAAVTATVHMRAATDAELAEYVASGESFDKAGAYAAQGQGGRLIAAIDGCVLTVVGLPVCRLARLLSASGVAVPADVPAGCAARTGRPCVAGCCILSDASVDI